jgi:adenine-specific DNA methylase
MAEKKIVTETGWNLDSSYARLPELFYTRLRSGTCAFT